MRWCWRGGKIVGRTLKHELPNYGTFDEKRVFASGPLPEPIAWRGLKLGVPICEDIWQDRVCAHLAEAGADMLLVPNGSPFEIDKDEHRQSLVRSRVVSTGLALAYVNRVGGQDELAFDGSSFIVNPDGERVVQMCDWEEALLLTEWEKGASGRWACHTEQYCELDDFPEGIYHAMMIALRDYVGRNGFPVILACRRDRFPCRGGRGRRIGATRSGGDDAVEIYVGGKPGRRGRKCSAARLPP